PASRLVLDHLWPAAEHRIDDAPAFLDFVLPLEQGGIAIHRVAEQALVRLESFAAVLAHEELDGLAIDAVARIVAGRARARAERDLGGAAELKAQVVRRAARNLDAREDVLRRRLQRDAHLGRGQRQRLARADEERNAGPAPRVDVELERRVGLDVGAGRDARLLPI